MPRSCYARGSLEFDKSRNCAVNVETASKKKQACGVDGVAQNFSIESFSGVIGFIFGSSQYATDCRISLTVQSKKAMRLIAYSPRGFTQISARQLEAEPVPRGVVNFVQHIVEIRCYGPPPKHKGQKLNRT